MNEALLKTEEKLVYSLRSLYHNYGYLPYSMSKFEEYEFYIQNKEFLVSDRVIAFNDTNGKMLALKPDVTLSIIKSGVDREHAKQKVFYNENVYRVSKTTHRYKEIMQAGLECIGDIDLYDIFEVIHLAAESLSRISENFVLAISHLGILSDILNQFCTDSLFQAGAIKLLSVKNTHDLAKLCDSYGLGEATKQKVVSLTSIYGSGKDVIKRICDLSDSGQIPLLEKLSVMLDCAGQSKHIVFDFSLADDMNYYNGFIFKGFVPGIASEILSGGQYDNLMRKINRNSRAIGFAIYLDLLDKISGTTDGYDFDVLLLYDDNTEPITVANKIALLRERGLSCSAQKTIPEKISFKEICDLRKESEKC